jgi:hypothetical protein
LRNTVVIKIKDRFFCNFSKTNRVQTAWSLAGATFFVEHEINGGLRGVLKKLNSKKITYQIFTIKLDLEVTQKLNARQIN